MKTEHIVVDEDQFEKFLKSKGIKFEKTKGKYVLKTPIVVRQTAKRYLLVTRIRRISPHRQGKLFEGMIRNALKSVAEKTDRFWWQRLWDYRTYVRVNPLLFAAKQPADYMACAGGTFYLIECKSSMANRYRLDNVKPHQELSAEAIRVAGGTYWFLILKRQRHGRKHRLFAFDTDAWFALKSATLKTPYISATWEDIEKYATFELFKKGGIWNLYPLFKELNT